jgi:hypothetical protein
MKKIATQVRSFVREIKKNYPGISDEAANEAVKTLYTIVLTFEIDEDEKAWDEFAKEVYSLAEKGETPWATELSNARIERARPYYLTAVARGTDPVPAIQTIFDISEDAACDIVNKLAEEKPSIPAPATDSPVDPFATNEDKDGEKDEEREEQYA